MNAEASTAKVEEATSTVVEGITSTEGREKCTRQLVQSAAKSVKYLSSQLKASQFTARIALKSTDLKEDQEETTKRFYSAE